jgi:hypothetical protein
MYRYSNHARHVVHRHASTGRSAWLRDPAVRKHLVLSFASNLRRVTDCQYLRFAWLFNSNHLSRDHSLWYLVAKDVDAKPIKVTRLSAMLVLAPPAAYATEMCFTFLQKCSYFNIFMYHFSIQLISDVSHICNFIKRCILCLVLLAAQWSCALPSWFTSPPPLLIFVSTRQSVRASCGWIRAVKFWNPLPQENHFAGIKGQLFQNRNWGDSKRRKEENWTEASMGE